MATQRHTPDALEAAWGHKRRTLRLANRLEQGAVAACAGVSVRALRSLEARQRA